jgi:hypothetical protein
VKEVLYEALVEVLAAYQVIVSGEMEEKIQELVDMAMVDE